MAMQVLASLLSYSIVVTGEATLTAKMLKAMLGDFSMNKRVTHMAVTI